MAAPRRSQAVLPWACDLLVDEIRWNSGNMVKSTIDLSIWVARIHDVLMPRKDLPCPDTAEPRKAVPAWSADS